MAQRLKATRTAAETLAQDLHQQGLTAHDPEEIFAPSTLDL
jgi:hypothetical protein